MGTTFTFNGLNFKGIIKFLRDLPRASAYVMRN